MGDVPVHQLVTEGGGVAIPAPCPFLLMGRASMYSSWVQWKQNTSVREAEKLRSVTGSSKNKEPRHVTGSGGRECENTSVREAEKSRSATGSWAQWKSKSVGETEKP